MSKENKWHSGKEIPNPSTGSFLILNNDGSMAEAEYKEGHWFQYRWGATIKEVVAWCSFSDIERPKKNKTTQPLYS